MMSPGTLIFIAIVAGYALGMFFGMLVAVAPRHLQWLIVPVGSAVACLAGWGILAAHEAAA